ncbi:MAG: transposase [Deltaproteobacteria bacterium]
MSNYRRVRNGSVYFFTVVTYKRQPVLCLNDSRTALRQSIKTAKEKMPFEIKAWVLLPDHLHCIWELPERNSDYSKRWALIKREFTKRMKGRLKTPSPGPSRIRSGEATIWQRRFGEHMIKDDLDFTRHAEYIHYNPVRHGLAALPKDWKLSSFHKFAAQGLYPENWCGNATDIQDIAGE